MDETKNVASYPVSDDAEDDDIDAMTTPTTWDGMTQEIDKAAKAMQNMAGAPPIIPPGTTA